MPETTAANPPERRHGLRSLNLILVTICVMSLVAVTIMLIVMIWSEDSTEFAGRMMATIGLMLTSSLLGLLVNSIVGRTLDVLLANAGLYLSERGWEVDAARVDAIGRTNVLGVMHSIHAVLPHFISQGTGDIIVTSSVSGHQVIAWEPIYSATKHAVQAFVHGTRQQLVGSGVRLGAIAPGIVLNELWGVVNGDASIETEVAAGRGMRSEDVASAVMFMLNTPRHITIRDLVMLPTNQEI